MTDIAAQKAMQTPKASSSTFMRSPAALIDAAAEVASGRRQQMSAFISPSGSSPSAEVCHFSMCDDELEGAQSPSGIEDEYDFRVPLARNTLGCGRGSSEVKRLNFDLALDRFGSLGLGVMDMGGPPKQASFMNGKIDGPGSAVRPSSNIFGNKARHDAVFGSSSLSSLRAISGIPSPTRGHSSIGSTGLGNSPTSSRTHRASINGPLASSYDNFQDTRHISTSSTSQASTSHLERSSVFANCVPFSSRP
jgi:hypothetical protein